MLFMIINFEFLFFLMKMFVLSVSDLEITEVEYQSCTCV